MKPYFSPLLFLVSTWHSTISPNTSKRFFSSRELMSLERLRTYTTRPSPMAFSRRFLACRTLGVPSEHGPLLSHLSVNKQTRGTHSQEGPRQGGRVELLPEARHTSLELAREGRRSPARPVPGPVPSSGSPGLGMALNNVTSASGQPLGRDHWEPPCREIPTRLNLAFLCH